MINTINIYSHKKKSVVQWNVKMVVEIDDGKNEHRVIAVTHEDEIHRLSPSTTDEEIKRFARSINEEFAPIKDPYNG